jgi:acetyl-CoA C-acetyltransferase
MVDAGTPVIVGVGQLTQRPADLADALEPVAMMAEVADRAATDAAAPGLLSRVELVVVVKGAWTYLDPGRIVAETIRAPHARTALTTDGGNTPQMVVDTLAERIVAGDLDVALVVGAEGIWSRRRMRAAGMPREVTRQADVAPDELIGRELAMTTEHEQARHVVQPVDVYPLFEGAIRHRRSETLDAHRDRIASMWAGFNAAAVTNPYAWLREPMTATDIREPSSANRMVAFPYTKAMCSNWDLDQAGALILCSAQAAAAAGVPRDRWVFPIAAAEAEDTHAVTTRYELGRSPALAAAWTQLSWATGLSTDDVASVDLYSCFPSAVQATAEALGLEESRPLTVTGGLTFAGGPLNNYVTHSIATMVGVLRDEPGSTGLITANGGFLTKHALGLYSTNPGSGFTRLRLEASEVPHHARTGAGRDATDVTVEACTVVHDRTGPVRALFAGLLDDGRRQWGCSDDQQVMAAVMTCELAGRRAHVDDDGTVRL